MSIVCGIAGLCVWTAIASGVTAFAGLIAFCEHDDSKEAPAWSVAALVGGLTFLFLTGAAATFIYQSGLCQ